MPDDIDSQPPEENVGASADESTDASAGQPQATDTDAPDAEPSEASSDVSTPDQPPETPTSTDADAADDALDWAAEATADRVLADAQVAQPDDPESIAEAEETDELLLSQNELNDLLGQSDELVAETAAEDTAASDEAVEPVSKAAGEPAIADIDPSSTEAAAAESVQLPEFPPPSQADSIQNSIDLLHDVELAVKIELGRTELYVEDVLRLGAGSVVELDKLAGDPVDVWVNNRLIARGEVLVLNDNFCVRVNEILSPVVEMETET